MKILFIIGTIAGGGAEKVVSILSSQLSKKHQVSVFVDERSAKEYAVAQEVEIICLPENQKSFIKKIKYLKALKKERGYDVAISFSVMSALSNVLSKKDEKIITSVRATTSGTTSKARGRILNWCCRKSDKVIAVSEYSMLDMINSFGVDADKCMNIYNPADLPSIEKSIAAGDSQMSDAQKSIMSSVAGKKVIVTHGRLSSEKAHCHLIRSFAKLAEQNHDIALIIVGDGPLEDKLNGLISSLNAQNKVFLFGHTTNPYAVLAKSDIYAFSSSCEGFPNAVLDAMACNLPVVSSDCHGVRELIAPDTPCDSVTEEVSLEEYGILSRCFDDKWMEASDELTLEEKCFVKAMSHLLENEKIISEYKHKSGVRIQDFAMDKIVAQWEEAIS